MAKKALAFLLSVLVIGAALFFSNRRQSKVPQEPESVVWRMLDQSRTGNVQGYLDCFTGSTLAQLNATAQGMTLPKFSEYLKESVRTVKGVAVFDTQRQAENRATLVIEYVYQDQNERQRMHVKSEEGTWRIESAEASRRIQPLIPYGKPVADPP